MNTDTHYIDDNGHQHQACHICGTDCSTHPDAANPLATCGDCGGATCLDHRVEDPAQRCTRCAAVYYRTDAGFLRELAYLQHFDSVLVLNGEVVGDLTTEESEQVVICDRCGRKFIARNRFCVCRG